VVGLTRGYFHSSLDHQLDGIHAIKWGCAMEAIIPALLWHFYAGLRALRRGHRPGRSNTEPRALVARLVNDATQVVCALLLQWRVPCTRLVSGIPLPLR